MSSLSEVYGLLLDELAYVMGAAPDFPYRDYRPANDQETLEENFSSLREHFEQFAARFGECEEIINCLQWIEEAYQMYLETGEQLPGAQKLNSVYGALSNFMQNRRRKKP